MNIPEITNALRQESRSESSTYAQSVDRSQPSDGTNGKRSLEVVQKQEEAQDKKSSNFSKEELNELIADVEEQLEKNDVSLKFNVIEEDDTVQVEIVDGDGKTIRKIPDDDLVRLSKSLKNLDRGFLDETS